MSAQKNKVPPAVRSPLMVMNGVCSGGLCGFLCGAELLVEVSRMAEHLVSACLLLGKANRSLLNGNVYFTFSFCGRKCWRLSYSDLDRLYIPSAPI